MIFNEIYSAYYHTVSKIIKHIIEDGAKEGELQEIVNRYAFEESVLTILPSLKSGKWQLVNKDYTTPLRHAPTMPLTLLEKRWLKAVSLDKRIKLFGFSFTGLENIEPLFTEEDYYVYDQYGDGDPYDDEQYVERFQLILSAIRDKTPLKIEMTNRQGKSIFIKCIPTRLEYSEKDDKFRLYTSGCRFITVVNLARIVQCNVYQGEHMIKPSENPIKTATVTLEITDERNALERVMLHFAHFEKRAECIGKRKYRLHINYNVDDEPEMVIRILSFGPLVEVVAPTDFRELIKNKLKKQQICGLK